MAIRKNLESEMKIFIMKDCFKNFSASPKNNLVETKLHIDAFNLYLDADIFSHVRLIRISSPIRDSINTQCEV